MNTVTKNQQVLLSMKKPQRKWSNDQLDAELSAAKQRIADAQEYYATLVREAEYRWLVTEGRSG